MHTILSSLVAAALSILALLGCSWHRVHGCAVCETTQRGGASPEVSPAMCCCQHDAHHDEDDCSQAGDAQRGGHGPSHQAPCKCQIDCCGTCAFLPSSRAVSLDRQSAPSDYVAATLPVLATSQSTRAMSRLLGSGWTRGTPPLRLHLLHQILLI